MDLNIKKAYLIEYGAQFYTLFMMHDQRTHLFVEDFYTFAGKIYGETRDLTDMNRKEFMEFLGF